MTILFNILSVIIIIKAPKQEMVKPALSYTAGGV